MSQAVPDGPPAAPQMGDPIAPARGRGTFRGRGFSRGRAAYLMRRRDLEILNGWKFTLTAMRGFAMPQFAQVPSQTIIVIFEKLVIDHFID